MSFQPKTIAVIGAGVIGVSWAAAFAAAGHKVRMTDIREEFEALIRVGLRAAIADISDDGDAAFARISYHARLEDALKGADLVQENGPERPEFKQKMFAEIERLVGPDTLLVSTSSGIPPEIIGKDMTDPSRAIIGHPFNPPHLIPLVEVCAIEGASDETVGRVMDFYRGCGKVPVRLNKAVPGFVANRLQVALVREAIALVEDGVVDVAGIDQIMLNSLGIRWASVGPLLTGQIGAGEGGIVVMVEKILASLIAGMHLPPISPAALAKLGAEANAAYPLAHLADFEKVRDARQKLVMAAQRENPLPVIAG